MSDDDARVRREHAEMQITIALYRETLQLIVDDQRTQDRRHRALILDRHPEIRGHGR